MGPLLKSLLIFIGAGLGGNARYWFGGWVSSRASAAFPWGTMAVNVSGCLLIGLAAGALLQHPNPTPWRLLLIVGFLGGYTTFSSFSLETLNLITERSYALALANILVSCLLGLTATWMGLTLVRYVTKS